VASSGDAFTQELRARGQVWETDRIKNHLCVPRLNHDLTQEKAGNKILAFSESTGIFAHTSGQPVVRIIFDTAAGSSIVSDSHLLRELYPYHGPSVYGIGSTATPVDTIGTLLLFNAPSLLLTSCHFNVLSFAELRDHGNVILFHPDDDSFAIRAPNDSTIRFNREGNHYVHYVRFVTTSSGIAMEYDAIPHGLHPRGNHASGNQRAALSTGIEQLSPTVAERKRAAIAKRLRVTRAPKRQLSCPRTGQWSLLANGNHRRRHSEDETIIWTMSGVRTRQDH
jgi:hypothetical protein